MELIIFIIYIVVAILVGSMGKQRDCGFLEPFLISLFLTPICGMFGVLASERKSYINHKESVEKLLRVIVSKLTPEDENKSQTETTKAEDENVGLDTPAIDVAKLSTWERIKYGV